MNFSAWKIILLPLLQRSKSKRYFSNSFCSFSLMNKYRKIKKKRSSYLHPFRNLVVLSGLFDFDLLSSKNRYWIQCFIILLFTGLLSCRQNPGADPASVRQELRQREIVHLTQGQITGRAAELADSMLLQAELSFYSGLKRLENSASCKPALDSSINFLQSRYPVKLSYHFFTPGEADKKVPEKGRQLLDACRYSREHKLPIAANLQKDGEKEFLYTRVLTLSDANCQSCHLSHPRPELRGKTGDTIGIKMLRFSRKQVVMSFVE